MSGAHPVSVLAAMATGLVLVAACAGWGRLVARWARVPVDLGLSLSWGMAALLFLGGAAIALRVATMPVLMALVVVGMVAALVPLPRWTAGGLDRNQMLFLAGAAVILAVRLAIAADMGAREPCDDFLAYQPLIQQVLERGDLDAPFSLRRLAAYGGQTLLQAMAVPTGNIHAVNVVDAGLGPIFLLGLGWSFLTRYGRPQPLPLAAAVSIGLILLMRVNSTSQATSLVCFLALVRTLQLMLESERRTRLCVVLGLLAAAASSLRHMNLLFPALLLLAFAYGHVRARGWRALLSDGAVVGLSWTAFLLPWMVALFVSSGTPLYPLFPGFHDPAFDFRVAPGGWGQVAETIGEMVAFSHILVILLGVPAAFLVPKDRSIGAVQLTALFGAMIIMVAFPGAAPLHMGRYIQPTLATAFFITTLGVLATGVVRTRLLRLALSGIVIFGLGREAIASVLMLSGVTRSQWSGYYSPALFDERMAAYAEAQQLVPAGVPIFVYVSTPFAFDSSRNRILNADEPGPVSPPPGLPFFHGAEAVAAYLRGQGIRYVAFEDFDTAVTWCIAPAGLDRITEPLWQPWKRYLADLRANLAGLAGAHRVVYAAHGVTVIDLGATR